MKPIKLFFAKIRRMYFNWRINREIFHRISPHLRNEGNHGYSFRSKDEMVRLHVRGCLHARLNLRLIEQTAAQMPKFQGDAFRYIAYSFADADRDVTGVASTMLQYPANAFTEATEIKPGDSTEVTIRFHSIQSRNATAGVCRLQLGFLLGDDFNNGYGLCTLKTFMAKMDAE